MKDVTNICPKCGEASVGEPVVLEKYDDKWYLFHFRCLAKRSRKGEAEKLKHRIQLMLNDDDYDMVCALSYEEGISAWCRKAIKERLEREYKSNEKSTVAK